MPSGKIRESKVKVNIAMEKTLKAELDAYALEQERTTSNLMVVLLKRGMAAMKKGDNK